MALGSARRMAGWLGFPVFILLVLNLGCSRSERVVEERKELAYPAPRYPRYLAQPSTTDLLKAARVAVRQPTGRSPLGKMQSGQEVYVIFEWGQDMQVWEVIKEAWAERGVKAHALGMWDVMGITKEEYDRRVSQTLVRGNDGWKELGNFRYFEYKPFFPENIRKEFGDAITDAYVRSTFGTGFLDRNPQIKHFYVGQGGGWAADIGPRHADKDMGNWVYMRPIDLLSKAAEFPADVWNLVEEKILRPIPFVSEVTFQDPEGTNLHFTVTPDQAKFWARRRGTEASNHIYIYPNPLHATLKEGAVLRGHANHTGMYPTVTVRLNRHGGVERIESGGRTGELFEMLLNHSKFKEARFPKSPVPGYWFLRQDGFATNPKFVRSMPALTEGEAWMANRSDRNRAGVQHLAFAYDSDDPADLTYAKERRIPLGRGEHTMHMHIYFPTIRWKLRDTGEWITIAEKGYVKAFEDPEVRALAARYGDVDLIFRYEWIPSLPGINIPGNYDKDFAPDPWSWILKEWATIKDGSYQHYVEDYSLADLKQAGFRP